MDTPFNPQPNQYPNPNGYNSQMGNGEPPMPPQNPGQLPPQNPGQLPPQNPGASQNSPSFGASWGEQPFPPQNSPSFRGFPSPVNGGTEGGVKTIDWGEASWGEPPRPKRSLLWLWITLAVLVVAGGIVAIVLLTKDKSATDPAEEKTEAVKETDDDYEDYDDPKAYGSDDDYEEDDIDITDDEDDWDIDIDDEDDDLYIPRSTDEGQGTSSTGAEEEVSEEDKAIVKFVFDSFENVTDEEIMQTFQYLLDQGRFTPKQYRYAVREHLRRQQQYAQ